MKSISVSVCALIAAFIAHPAFGNDKRTTSPRGGEVWAVPKVHKEAKTGGTAAKPPAVAVKALPPKRAWVGHTVTISPCERDAIRAYVRNRIDASKLGKPNGVPQGLAKKVAWPGGMPDGWEKKCVRGRVLSEEVHKHCQPLPEELTMKLPPPPPGTVLLAVDGKVVRVGYPTYEILDTFDIALDSNNPHVHWVTVAQARSAESRDSKR